MTQIDMINALRSWCDTIESDVHKGKGLITNIEYSSPIRDLYEGDNGIMVQDQPYYTLHISVDNIKQDEPKGT